MTYFSRAQRLERGKLAIHGALAQADILAALVDYGYTQADLSTTGVGLISAAEEALTTQGTTRGTKAVRSITDADSEQEARQAISDYVKLCRAIFSGDPIAISALGLSSPGRTLPEGRVAFVAAARSLLAAADVAPETVQAKLTLRSYGPAKRAELAALIEALTHSEVQQRLAQANAQQATPDAEAALKALDAYVRELRTVAKIALKGRPQLLEAMGIKAH